MSLSCSAEVVLSWGCWFESSFYLAGGNFVLKKFLPSAAVRLFRTKCLKVFFVGTIHGWFSKQFFTGCNDFHFLFRLRESVQCSIRTNRLARSAPKSLYLTIDLYSTNTECKFMISARVHGNTNSAWMLSRTRIKPSCVSI